uniref:hypothetical protein n=1 Tax=Cyanothece sp. BG0011 TaxID=2082950 RepID=UPI001E5F46F5|nr:hypothetical protein [Cyanothece sp. BG0011]
MKQSPCVEIELPLEKRVNFLLEEYCYLTQNPDILKNKLHYLKTYYGWDKLSQWYHWIDNQQWQELVEDLLIVHYDPAYTRSLKKMSSKIMTTISLSDLNLEHLIETLRFKNHSHE